MEVSSDSVSIDIDNLVSFAGKEVRVKTSKGSISVFVSGNREKPALITYPDVALNYMSCFRGLFFCQDAASLLVNNFCIYHIDAPGHELGADVISSDMPLLSVDDLADQVAEVLDFFGLEKVFCLGVTAGAYILTLFSMKYEERVAALILVSPICRAPSWREWIYNKILLNLLYFYGMCGLLKECLLHRYFSKELRHGTDAESDTVLYYRRLLHVLSECLGDNMLSLAAKLLDEMQSPNIMRFLHAINERHDLTEGLRNLQCKTLIFVGENSPFHADAVHMSHVRGKKVSALVEVQSCGSLVTEELPYAMLVPIEFFLMGFGFHRQTPVASLTSKGSLSPKASRHWCIAPELLSSESLGVKLKPIKTRPIIKT